MIETVQRIYGDTESWPLWLARVFIPCNVSIWMMFALLDPRVYIPRFDVVFLLFVIMTAMILLASYAKDLPTPTRVRKNRESGMEEAERQAEQDRQFAKDRPEMPISLELLLDKVTGSLSKVETTVGGVLRGYPWEYDPAHKPPTSEIVCPQITIDVINPGSDDDYFIVLQQPGSDARWVFGRPGVEDEGDLPDHEHIFDVRQSFCSCSHANA